MDTLMDKNIEGCRLTLPDESGMTSDQKKIYKQIVSGPRKRLVGPLRAALHNPSLADKWQQLGQVLRFEISLPAYLKELAIIVTARRWSSELEWVIHVNDAAQAGLNHSIINDIGECRSPDFGDDEAAARVYEFSREVTLTGQVSDEVYRSIAVRWGELGVVELTALVGYYSMVAMTLNAHRIPLPEGAKDAVVKLRQDANVLPPLAE